MIFRGLVYRRPFARPFALRLIAALTGVALVNVCPAAGPAINEIYFEAPQKRSVEFIELHNPGAEPISLTGWSLNTYSFAPNTVMKPGEFLVVALDPPAFEKEFGFRPLGPFIGKLKRSGSTVRLQDAQGKIVDEVHYGVGFPWPVATAGGGSSLERINPALPGNSPGSWRSSGFPANSSQRISAPTSRREQPAPIPKWQRPTPGARNSTFMEQPPPVILSVEHRPEQPKSGEPVVVTARVMRASGVTNLTLSIQLVQPGNYIRLSDKVYEKNWVELPMQVTGDPAAFTATVSGEFQKHRRLVRYRITGRNSARQSVQVPYPDDEVPNFAWFVYDGIPAWTGAAKPGQTPLLTFSSQMLGSLPVYHLIAREEDVSRSQWDGSYNRNPFYGTLVYGGHVYDHIRFHNRGQASTYLAGKNKWAFKFNRGHGFRPKDNYGRLYANGWHNLDLSACASPWVQMNRGMAGMDEALAFRSYQLAGVPSANTHWIHFRVIERAEESSSGDQYQSDLWGLYLVVQPMDGPWLDELGLPSGNVYSLQSGRKHLARGMPADNSDWYQFRSGLQRNQTETWWRNHLNLSAFYSFHALNGFLSNVDLREEANHGYYHAPDQHWAPIPWDNDMMFIPHSHQSGIIEAVRCLQFPALNLEFKNRAREILDLFASDASPTGGQFAQLVDECARILCPTDQPRTWPELDMAMWNSHPRSNTSGEFYLNPYTRGWSGVPFRRELDTADFAGFCRYIVRFCSDSRPQKNYEPDDNNPLGYGWGYLSWEAKDDKLPERPTVRFVGGPGFPRTNLAFNITAFSPALKQASAQAGFAAVQWRLAEIRAPGLAGYKGGAPFAYELTPRWQSDELTRCDSVFTFPSIAEPGHTYRVRARYKDLSGRWSHWSEPVQFVPKEN